MSRLRRTLLASFAAVSLVAVPAFADPGKDPREPKEPRQGNSQSGKPDKDKDDKGKDKPKPRPPHEDPCTGDPGMVLPLSYASGGGTADALYVLPATRPRGIVVFNHGYGHTMYSWVSHMQRTARTLGVIAVTPNYRGQVDTPGTPRPTSRGWRVAEGAVDTNTVAALFDRTCLKGHGYNVLYSVSMGGNTAGLALAAKPKRQGGKPMFDAWVNVEGAVNVLEIYQAARVLAPANPFAKNAVADIEQEMGGSFEQVPAVYAERTVVNRVDDIAASGIKGVVMVHGVADGLVSYDQARQLQARLLALKIPVDLTTFLTRTTSAEPGTTVDGYIPSGQTSPFAGHASEASETHDVGMWGFGKLAALYPPLPQRGAPHGDKNRPAPKQPAVGCADLVKDGQTGQSVGGPYPCP